MPPIYCTDPKSVRASGESRSVAARVAPAPTPCGVLEVENARYVVGLVDGARVVVTDVAETGVVRTVVADARRHGAEVVEADVQETARVDENESADEPSSLAKPSQAVAASSIGEQPGPVNINKELISGGAVKKLIRERPPVGATRTSSPGTVACPKRHHPVKADRRTSFELTAALTHERARGQYVDAHDSQRRHQRQPRQL